MGLDMYLTASKYVSGWDFQKEPEKAAYRALVALFGVGNAVAKGSPGATVEFTVAYWRKANAIHRWFVTKVQRGKDDCGSYGVSREELQELRSTCVLALEVARTAPGQVWDGTRYDANGATELYKPGEVVTNAAAVAEVLPTLSGFFFGGTDYDEGYLQDLHDTIEQVDRALKLPDGWSFEYRASW